MISALQGWKGLKRPSEGPGTVDREGHFDSWRENISAHGEDDASFLSYFDTASGVEEAFMQGQWDFAHHLLKPTVIPLIGEPFEATALEIGFGGGRLLAASSRYFKQVYGVDIHDEFERVEDLLRQRGVENATLLRGDGRTLPVEDQSIDFVYSFIVLQHLPSIDVLQTYLAEVKRVLRPGRPACLYVGHLGWNWRGIRHADCATHEVASSRENTLLLRPRQSERLFRQAGLTCVELGRARKKPWRTDLGNQHYIIATA